MRCYIPSTNEFSAFMLLLFTSLLCLKTRNRIDYYSLLNKAGTKKSNHLKYRKLIRERYISLLIIMLNPLSSFAKGQYQIDLIVFAKPSSGTNISALMINTPIPPLAQNALKLTSDTAKTGKSYELLSPAKSSLRDALYQLNRNHQYTILGHYSWIQPTTNKTSIALPLTTHDGWQMQGTMTIKEGIFYSFNSTLQISPPSSPDAFFTVTQNQRLKANTMYYFDHPQIEMLVKIHQVA